jgi:hypothetical protein
MKIWQIKALRYGPECPYFSHSTPTLHFPCADLRPKSRQAPKAPV